MGLITWIKRLFGAARTEGSAGFDPGAFVFVVVRDSSGPLQRGEVYEDPIDAALRARDLGQVTGGGSQLGEAKADGTPTIAWCGIDVDLPSAAELEEALLLLRAELQRLEVPVGSELHYTERGSRFLDRLEANGWQLRQPRDILHPGFRC
ncbi:MAG: hypothetical protein IT456_02740 [Planctomycetes bacterium]|jgi:hypothetical protein|nr:hypothetical protein [Planctomycetota bacterium]